MGQYLPAEVQAPPSIMMCCAPDLYSLRNADVQQEILAKPIFDWEVGRIGASGNVIEVGPGEWLLSYHGKQNQAVGYTQSFMLLADVPNALPQIRHRCPERLLVPEADWEQPGRFESPVIFITGMAVVDNGETLLLSYGAADEKVGVARLDMRILLARLRKYDARGQHL